VRRWAAEAARLPAERACVLEAQEVDGEALLLASEAQLAAILPMGCVVKLMSALVALKQAHR
jgi:hypothetical protein